MFDEILKKFGIPYEDLEPEERETYNVMLAATQQAQLTPEKLKDYISSMRFQVEQALVDEPEFNYIFIWKVPNWKQIMLKARLKNYMLLESFLLGPERAQKQLERTLSTIKQK